MKTVADPERRRSGIGFAIHPAERFVPFEGDSGCGSNEGVERRFFAPSKKWG